MTLQVSSISLPPSCVLFRAACQSLIGRVARYSLSLRTLPCISEIAHNLMAINFEHLLILCGEPPGHCRPQRHATQRPQRYNRGKEKTSPRDGFFALTPTMAQDRTEPGPPRATANGRHRRRPTARSHAHEGAPRHCNWHCGWRLPGLVPTAKEKSTTTCGCIVPTAMYISIYTLQLALTPV